MYKFLIFSLLCFLSLSFLYSHEGHKEMFIYSYSAPYSGLMETLLVWHMWLGIGTAILTIVVAFMREKIGLSKLYYVLLIILVFMLNAAGFFGGSVTFGPFHMYPPNRYVGK